MRAPTGDILVLGLSKADRVQDDARSDPKGVSGPLWECDSILDRVHVIGPGRIASHNGGNVVLC